MSSSYSQHFKSQVRGSAFPEFAHDMKSRDQFDTPLDPAFLSVAPQQPRDIANISCDRSNAFVQNAGPEYQALSGSQKESSRAPGCQCCDGHTAAANCSNSQICTNAYLLAGGCSCARNLVDKKKIHLDKKSKTSFKLKSSGLVRPFCGKAVRRKGM